MIHTDGCGLFGRTGSKLLPTGLTPESVVVAIACFSQQNQFLSIYFLVQKNDMILQLYVLMVIIAASSLKARNKPLTCLGPGNVLP